MRAHRIFAAAAVATTALLVPLASPASAAVTATTAGTGVLVTATGNVSVTAACTGGVITINGTTPLPALPCGAVTAVLVNGDAGNQTVQGTSLDLSAFTANPRLGADLGDGSDLVTESEAADTIDLGPGADSIVLDIDSAANTELDLGTGTDFMRFYGSPLGDGLSLTSSGAGTTILATTPNGPAVWAVESAESIIIESGAGDDTVSSANVTPASALASITVSAGTGDDTMTAGPTGMLASGGPGTNTFNGSSGSDRYTSSSSADTIKLAGGAQNQVTDVDSLRSGGRAISGSGSTDLHLTDAKDQDAVFRVRPGLALGTARLTTSLHRTGQQALPASFDRIVVFFDADDDKPDAGLADVVAVRQDVTVNGDPADDDVLDVTIPTGGWQLTENPGGLSFIDPDNASYGRISFSNSGTISVHAPWANANEGFGHRVIRDLQFRIATPGERTTIRTDLTNGTRTRAQVVAGLMDTDLYRGLDVDRTFVDFLDRKADPSGRAFWIDSLDGGKSLIQFRAQLFGSSEYFNRSGATNAGYVRAAYRDVLGRLPDASGEAYWVGKINGGTDRGLVAKQFLASTEARRTIVEDQYLRFLDRLPTQGESATWVTNLGNQSQGEQQLIASLAGSLAYFQRT